MQRLGVSQDKTMERRVLCAAVLAVGALSFTVPAAAQDSLKEPVSRDIDRVLKSIQDSDTGSSPSGQHVPEARSLVRRENGYLRVLAAPPGRYFPVSLMIRSDPLATAKDFLKEHGVAFGLGDEPFDFTLRAVKAGSRRTHLRLDQTWAGIPVFAAQMVVQLNEEGNVEYVSSDIMTQDDAIELESDWVAPVATQAEAEEIAVGTLMVENAGMQFRAEPATLMIYQPSAMQAPGAWSGTSRSSACRPRG